MKPQQERAVLKVSSQTEQGSPLLCVRCCKSALICQLGQFWQPPMAKSSMTMTLPHGGAGRSSSWLSGTSRGIFSPLCSVQVVMAVYFIQVLPKPGIMASRTDSLLLGQFS